ncbi:hypothetical protein C0993_001812 [Termitomyces sp. T159_Od127]|nr:hypothetical protein C0993_001812 [Termitomyces sp. T159_Od127]
MPATSSGGGQAKPPNPPTCTTRHTASGIKVNSMVEAKEWLCAGGYTGTPNSPITTEVLKAAILHMSRRVDVPADTKEGMHALAFGLEVMEASNTEKTVVEAVERAMEGYKEMLETLAETSVQTVKEMAEHAKEEMGKADMEEGQINQQGKGRRPDPNQGWV